MLILKSVVFWLGDFDFFFFEKRKKETALFPWKQVKVYWLARMGRNFDNFLVSSQNSPRANISDRSVPTSQLISTLCAMILNCTKDHKTRSHQDVLMINVVNERRKRVISFYIIYHTPCPWYIFPHFHLPKGQLISKANSELFIWSKNQQKYFCTYFCPSL